MILYCLTVAVAVALLEVGYAVGREHASRINVKMLNGLLAKLEGK